MRVFPWYLVLYIYLGYCIMCLLIVYTMPFGTTGAFSVIKGTRDVLEENCSPGIIITYYCWYQSRFVDNLWPS